jgi:predicted GNAT family N-acyltransferase
MLYIQKVVQDYQMDAALSIRNIVFVDEQKVPEDLEHDEHDATAHHYLAIDNDTPCGTARWRETADGVKLERFAVLKNYRDKGVGSSLVQVVLMDVRNYLASNPQANVYLHSQLEAVPFYEKLGFKTTGPMFAEAGINHFKMVLEQ